MADRSATWLQELMLGIDRGLPERVSRSLDELKLIGWSVHVSAPYFYEGSMRRILQIHREIEVSQIPFS